MELPRKVRRWFLRRLPACEDLLPVMSESLERELSFRRRWTLKWHLLVCKWCRDYLKQLWFLRDAYRNEESEESLSTEARERMKRALRSQ